MRQRHTALLELLAVTGDPVPQCGLLLYANREGDCWTDVNEVKPPGNKNILQKQILVQEYHVLYYYM